MSRGRWSKWLAGGLVAFALPYVSRELGLTDRMPLDVIDGSTGVIYLRPNGQIAQTTIRYERLADFSTRRVLLWPVVINGEKISRAAIWRRYAYNPVTLGQGNALLEMRDRVISSFVAEMDLDPNSIEKIRALHFYGDVEAGYEQYRDAFRFVLKEELENAFPDKCFFFGHPTKRGSDAILIIADRDVKDVALKYFQSICGDQSPSE